jgi:hypothetical protein
MSNSSRKQRKPEIHTSVLVADVFTNLMHPSHMRDERRRSRVKSFTSEYNRSQKVVRQGDLEEYPKPLFIDEEQETCDPIPSGSNDYPASNLTTQPVAQRGKPINSECNIVLRSRENGAADQQLKQQEAEPHKAGQDFGDDAGQVVDMIRDDFDDIFPDVGDLIIPHLEPFRISARARKRLPRLFDYYFRVFGPKHVWRPTLVTTAGIDQFRQDLFEVWVQNPTWLEATCALCEARLDFEAAPGGSLSLVVLQHRGRALQMVQHALEKSPHSVHDAIMWAVAATMAVDVLYANWASFHANLNGLRCIILMKGGLDNLSWFVSTPKHQHPLFSRSTSMKKADPRGKDASRMVPVYRLRSWSDQSTFELPLPS